VVTIHDAMFFSYPEQFLSHAREARRVPPFARACRAIITCSECSKTDIVHHMQVDPDKVHVVPWGLRHDLFRPHTDPVQLRKHLLHTHGIDRTYFLQVSCDIGRKNSPLLLEAYRTLLAQRPENDLVLLWRNPPAAVCTACQAKPLAGRVHLIASADDEQLRLLYCGATAMIFPSAYEGFGLPVLEAMACGTPVVTTRGGALSEVGGDAVHYVETNNLESLVAALEGIEAGSLGRTLLASKGLLRASEFTWERYVQTIVPLYSEWMKDE
jgi:glycosyltransferase involved in cell wall biosynthesis